MSPPFTMRLRTNYCPTDDEHLEIQGLLVEPTIRLKRLDDEIADLQKAMDKLAEERDSLGAFVAAHKALISPARRLPLDIIQEIFVACLQPTHRSDCVMSASEAPVPLGRICSTWRAISLSTPRLWARIHITEPQFYPGYSDPASNEHNKTVQRLEITKTWLDRSGDCPLSISLESARDVHGIASRGKWFIEALIPTAARWREIDFTTASFTVLEALSHLQVDAPLLTTIAFRHHFQPSPPEGEWSSLGILGGAQIRSLSLPTTLLIPEGLSLRWRELTTLKIGGPAWGTNYGLAVGTILHTISQCPRLRCCKLAVNEPDFMGFGSIFNHPVIELPFLHTFELRCATHSPIGTSFTTWITRFYDLWPPTGPGTSRMPRPRSIFDAFQLHGELGYRLHHVLEILAPRQFTRFTGRSLEDDALTALTPSSTLGTSVCPALQCLSLPNDSPITDIAVLWFITARMIQSRTLIEVDGLFHRKRTLDILPSLEPYTKTGLAVSLTYRELYQPPSQLSPWAGLVDAPQSPVTSWGLPHVLKVSPSRW
ncbi:hypothetical protein C8R47DRAFT_1322937 [Mycena vitilis]|nr:hypothetical protein C8R47DRAFT_1322937 [Mycena vitilis]